ncbi:MAG: pyridoxal 5'-phosphate synthase glutaminase subunit PdxT [Dehalococcoidia bacterium]|nr:pyridoxal 5'-phosphate synthase glutaminase subunit PdxT [Dehalococcoidia bacterium]
MVDLGLRPFASSPNDESPSETGQAKIGVLALQGDFKEHIEMINRLGAEAIPVRLPVDLEGIAGVIIPGGESTTISSLLSQFGILGPLREMITSGLPAMGTCAGMIVLARSAVGLDHDSLKVMDIEVRRNAFGRQVDSFDTELDVPALGDGVPLHAVFIRAPFIEAAGPGVEVLATLPDGRVVAARERNMLVLAFHPELTNDSRFHKLFLGMVDKYRSGEK